jgi:hypothetical protein
VATRPVTPITRLQRQFRRIAAFAGAMGVLSGYAIFIYYRQLYTEPETNYLQIVGALFIAAAVSYAIEWMRELIKRGEMEEHRHPLIGTMGTFVVALLFELFITGFHTAFENIDNATLQDVARRIVGGSSNEIGKTLTFPWQRQCLQSITVDKKFAIFLA